MRFPDWHARLLSLIAERKESPFAWGTNDCCMWAADAVLSMTGQDLAADLRGAYGSAHEAVKALSKLGGVQEAGARAGQEILPLLSQVGDIGLVVTGETRESLAVCIGEHWLAVTKNGLGLVDLSCASKAWRVA